MYFPRIEGQYQYGALLFLNQICSTKVQVFQLVGAERVAALSPVGAYEVERVVREHFLRPKDERLTSIVLH